jgi:hypothetical protein
VHSVAKLIYSYLADTLTRLRKRATVGLICSPVERPAEHHIPMLDEARGIAHT